MVEYVVLRMAAISGTPADYSNDIYSFYLELALIDEATDALILPFLGHDERCRIVSRENGSYFIHGCIQDIPEIVRALGVNNVAVYQVIRLAKLFDGR